MNASLWAAAAVATSTPTVLAVLAWKFRKPLAKDLGIDGERVKRQVKNAAIFSRDVGVNVLANLIAAAVIYLLAVMTGLLPNSPRVTLLAASVVLMALALVLFAFTYTLSGKRRFVASGLVLILGGIASVIVPFASIKSDWSAAILPLLGWTAILMGAFMIHHRRLGDDNK